MSTCDDERRVSAHQMVGERSFSQIEAGSSHYRPPVSDPPPDIPRYEVIDVLGEGGMGRVWRARQSGTRREVALKVIASGMFASQRALARFEREIEIAARLSHPCIARVFEAQTSGGVAYFAMELVDGVALDQYVLQHQLDQNAVLKLMVRVCEGVAHAHEHGVIHRDLKPSNVLVKGDGTPLVLDFGLAKVVDDNDSIQTMTIDGVLPGTPAYMSPEQASGRTNEVDTRSDVYALGVILYRMLIGDLPHAMTGTRLDLLRRIAEHDVARPRQKCPNLNRDLEAILLKCLALRALDRYGTAGELAGDISNFLAGNPVQARRATPLYHLGKHLRRHWQIAAVATTLVALLTIAGVIGVRSIIDARDDARAQLAQSLIAQGDVLATQQRYGESAQNYKQAYSLFHAMGCSTLEADLAYEQLCVVSAPPVVTLQFDGVPGVILPLADGRRCLVSVASSVYLVDIPTAHVDKRFGPTKGEVVGLDVTLDEQNLVTLTDGGELAIWGIENGSKRIVAGSVPTAQNVYFGFRDEQIIVASDDGVIRLWDAANGNALDPISTEHRRWQAAAPIAQSSTLIARGDDNRVYKIDVSTGEALEIVSTHYGPGTGLAISKFKQIAACEQGDRVTIWDLGVPPREQWCFGYLKPRTSVAVSRDGRRVAAGGSDGSIWVWKDDGEVAHVFYDPNGEVKHLAFTPDRAVLLSSTAAGLKVWASGDYLRGNSFSPLEMRASRFSRDGRMIAVVQSENSDHPPELWSVATGQPLQSFNYSSHLVDSIAITPDDREVLLGCADGQVRVWDTLSGQLKTVFHAQEAQDGPIYDMRFSPDQRVMAAAGADGSVSLWKPGTWEHIAFLKGHSGRVQALAISSDSKSLVSADETGALSLWDLEARLLRWSRRAIDGSINAVAISQNGDWIVAGGQDGKTVVLDRNSGQVVIQCPHDYEVSAVAFAEDARSVLTADVMCNVKWWDIKSGKLVRVQRQEMAQHPYDLRLIDNDRLLLFSAEQRVGRWNLKTLAEWNPQNLRAGGLRPSVSTLDSLASEYANRGFLHWAGALWDQLASTGAEIPVEKRVEAWGYWQKEDWKKAAAAMNSQGPSTRNDSVYSQLLQRLVVTRSTKDLR